MSYGANARVGLIFQNSWGTAGNTNSAHWLPVLNESVGVEIEQLQSESMRGVYDTGANYEGMKGAPGDLEIEANPISIGALLKAVLGPPTTNLVGSAYQHEFKPRQTEFDKFAANTPVTIHKYLADAGSAQTFYDLVGNALELNCAAGEFLSAKATFVGGKLSQIAAVAASYTTAKNWTWDQSSVSLGGAAKANLGTLNVKFEEAIEPGHVLNGSKFAGRAKRTGFRSISFDGTLKFDDQTEYQQFLSQTEQELVFTFQNSVAVSSGYTETLEIKLPLARITEMKPVAGGPGEIEVSFSGKGVYSPSSGTGAQLLLVNTQATY